MGARLGTGRKIGVMVRTTGARRRSTSSPMTNQLYYGDNLKVLLDAIFGPLNFRNEII
jgi:hypothetical protein